MAVRYSVQADSREECAAAVDELCTRMGAEPTMKPVQMSIDNRWLARAAPTARETRPAPPVQPAR